jgi:hypothetical protein
MGYEIYSRVILINDRYADEGVRRGAIGYVIEVYPDGIYEVEFSKPDGTTYAQIVADGNDLKPAPLEV